MKTDQQIKNINLALIGCGGIAQTHLQAIKAANGCQLIAVADINHESAKPLANHLNCSFYSDYRQIIANETIDAALICTPPNTHCDVTQFFLKNGIHVLCEKPLAINSTEASQMVKAAQQNGVLLMMASKFRYVEDVIQAKAIVDSGILGDIILYENVFCSKVDMQNRWYSKKEIAGGGVLLDNGCHSVDIARFFLGPIAKVQAEEGKRVQNLEVEDTARLYFKSKSGILGTVDLSWSIKKERESYIDIYGTKGVLSIGWKCSKYRLDGTSEWVEFGRGYDKAAAFRSQMQNFLDVIRGTASPQINGTDSLRSVLVIEAAYQSTAISKWIDV